MPETHPAYSILHAEQTQAMISHRLLKYPNLMPAYSTDLGQRIVDVNKVTQQSAQ
jgi:hypothetical protein